MPVLGAARRVREGPLGTGQPGPLLAALRGGRGGEGCQAVCGVCGVAVAARYRHWV